MSSLSSQATFFYVVFVLFELWQVYQLILFSIDLNMGTCVTSYEKLPLYYAEQTLNRK